MLVQSVLVPVQRSAVSVSLNRIIFLVTMVPLFLIGLALVYVTRPRRAANLLWLPFIYAYWMIQNALAFYAFLQILFRRPKKWTKTMKNGVTCNPETEKSLNNQRQSQKPHDCCYSDILIDHKP